MAALLLDFLPERSEMQPLFSVCLGPFLVELEIQGSLKKYWLSEASSIDSYLSPKMSYYSFIFCISIIFIV